MNWKNLRKIINDAQREAMDQGENKSQEKAGPALKSSVQAQSAAQFSLQSLPLPVFSLSKLGPLGRGSTLSPIAPFSSFSLPSSTVGWGHHFFISFLALGLAQTCLPLFFFSLSFPFGLKQRLFPLPSPRPNPNFFPSPSI